MVISRLYGRSIIDWFSIETIAICKTMDFLMKSEMISPSERIKGNKDFDRILLHYAISEICNVIVHNTTDYPPSFISTTQETAVSIASIKKVLPFINIHKINGSFKEFVNECETNGEYSEILIKDNNKKKSKIRFDKIAKNAEKYELKWLSETYFKSIEAKYLIHKNT